MASHVSLLIQLECIPLASNVTSLSTDLHQQAPILRNLINYPSLGIISFRNSKASLYQVMIVVCVLPFELFYFCDRLLLRDEKYV